MKKGIVFLLFTLITGISQTVGQELSFRSITTTEGLSNSWVRCFYQDNFGFIWIGTADGLNRFDGKNFMVYRPTTDNNFSLGNITVNDIIEKNDSILWIATDLGLFNFNLLTEIMTLDTMISAHPVLVIKKDHTNTYWFGTNHGLVEYNSILETRTTFTSNGANNLRISHDYINAITFDSNNDVWIGTKNGLNQFNRATQSFSIYQHSEQDGSISGNNITCIYEDHQKRIWIGTALNGLNLLHKTPDGYQFQQILEGSVSDIYADQHDRLWISFSIDKGIQLVDLKTLNQKQLTVQSVNYNPLVKNSLSENAVFCFFEDRLGDLWIGTFGHGINFYSARTKSFRNVTELFNTKNTIRNSLVNVLFDDEQYVWIGTEGGLDRLTKSTGEFQHYQHQPNNVSTLASNPVLAINKDSKGILWVGTWAGGLHKYNYQTNSFKRYVPGEEPGSIGSGNVFSIVEDNFHNLWIGTVSGGLNRFDYETETFKIYRNNPLDSTSLSARSMSSILVTHDGKLYISEYNVVDRYNYETDNFTHFPHQTSFDYQPGNITSIFEDSHHNLWSCANAGLELLDSGLSVTRIYTIADGLPDNTIQALLEDDSGNLWISTNKGISKFLNGSSIPDKPVFQNFTMADGLPANDFKSRAAMKNSMGVMYFGSSNGYTYFHPDSIKLNSIKPNIVFTNLFIQQTLPNEYSTYRSYGKNLNLVEKIDLHYPNSDFSISFAALNYLNSEENKYQYKLEGYDTEWINAGHSMSATYTNIPEGTFTFMVKGSNNDGIWSDNSKSITIVIHPIWYQSRWFKITTYLFLVFLSIIVLTLRFVSLYRTNNELELRVEKRTNELSKLNKLLEEKQTKIIEQNIELEKHQNHLEQLVKERTRQLESALIKAEESDHLKSSFLANMSHEIRTPMNAIIGFSAMLADENIAPEKREKYINQVKTNGKNLNILINDIIDISIIEAGQMILSKSEFNVNKILLELFHYFEHENNGKFNFEYLNMNSTRELIIYNDANRFRQIMVNLLSNAFKYSDAGKIEYGYEFFETEAQFFVRDSGIGIHPNERESIFKHFYKSQKDKSKLYRGTGIGLAICKNLVTVMGGKIWVESQLNVGSAFYFTLPIGKK